MKFNVIEQLLKWQNSFDKELMMFTACVNWISSSGHKKEENFLNVFNTSHPKCVN